MKTDVEKWLWSALSHINTLVDTGWDGETIKRCLDTDIRRIVGMVEGKVLVTPLTHEKDGAHCTTFPAIYGCGNTPEESRQVFEQRLEEVERNA